VWYAVLLVDLVFPAVIHRFLFVSIALLLVFTNPVHAGRYQRTKDRQIRVWNEHPERWDEAIWTGERDENGAATGPGVLTWFQLGHSSETGTRIPESRGHQLMFAISFKGTMNDGRFEGPVFSTDAVGRESHAKFVDGSPVTPWVAGSGSKEVAAKESTETTRKTATEKSATAEKKPKEPTAPAEGPAEVLHRSAVVEAPTQDSHTLEVFRPPSSLRASYVATASPAQSAPPTDLASKDPAVTALKEQTQTVLSRVGNATRNFSQIDRLDSVQPLPASVSDSIGSLANRTYNARSKIGEKAAFRGEAETSDALSVMYEVTRDLAAKDASGANAKLTQFLKNHPSPPADAQKPLWRYLSSAQSLCERQQKEADAHLHRAQSLIAAGHAAEAIEEYKEANRIFPSPVTAEAIRKLSPQSSTPTQSKP